MMARARVIAIDAEARFEQAAAEFAESLAETQRKLSELATAAGKLQAEAEWARERRLSRLLTAQELADTLNVSAEHLRNLVARGALVGVHVGSVLRFRESDVIRFLEVGR